ncbi:MAG: hypothetical protein ABI168_09520, partial [Ginsengibacter sp.]
MQPKIISCSLVFLIMVSFNLNAQTNSTTSDSAAIAPASTVESIAPKVQGLPQKHYYNIFKINLAALLFKSYSFQYERVLNRKFSVAIQYRTMPESGLPFKSNILKLVGDTDPNTKQIIEDFRMSNFAITPEVRIYLNKKGYGRGFYIAPFYRYASFSSNDLNVFYTDENNIEQSIKMSGKLNSNTFGFTIGAQNFIGKHLVFDWSLFGPHYGSGKGTFNGTPSKPLSPSEQ